MLILSLFARLEAKPGREADLAAFRMQGLELAQRAATTPFWFALGFGPSTFAIFDAFADEVGRQAHLAGPIAQALTGPALYAPRVATGHRTRRRAGRQTAEVGLAVLHQ
jgi:hypothetical protein